MSHDNCSANFTGALAAAVAHFTGVGDCRSQRPLGLPPPGAGHNLLDQVLTSARPAWPARRKLVISDSHEGIKAAISKVLHGTWQRLSSSLHAQRAGAIWLPGRRVVAAFIGTASGSGLLASS
jgi:hypothetical protein